MQRFSLRARAALAAAAFAFACSSPAVAQSQLSDAQAIRSSPLAATYDRLDEALRQAVTGADDAAAHWISAELTPLDIAFQAREYAAAAAAAPNELLYAATLARSCTLRTIPTLAPCDARDQIAYWATRDETNAVPWILLAERARQRKTPPDVAAQLQRAARSSRFDDYTQRSVALFAARLGPLAAEDRGVAALAASRYVARASGRLESLLAGLCGPRREIASDDVTHACVRIAALMIEAAPNAIDRAAGAALAATNASTGSGRAVADARASDIALARQRCSETFARAERIVAAPSDPAASRARAALARWVDERARGDELGACQRLANGLGPG